MGEREQLWCSWVTSAGRPYFTNLKVMRAVLEAIRGALVREGCELLAYLFLEDRAVFVAGGPKTALRAALETAGSGSDADFRRSDRKPLWGDRGERPLAWEDRQEVIASLSRLVAAAGSSDVREHPWAGGPWLFPDS